MLALLNVNYIFKTNFLTLQPEPTNGGEMHPKLELESVRQKKQRDSEAQSLPVSGD